MSAAALDPNFRRMLRIGDRALRIETNEPLVDEYLARACARFLVPSTRGFDSATVDDGVILWDGRAGSVWFNGRRIGLDSLVTDSLEAGIRGVATLIAEVLRRLSRQQALYALGVANGAACVAIAAAPGVGKTTLALELLRRGWMAFGDEFLLLDRETLVVEGIPLALMVREPSLAALNDARLERAITRGTLVSHLGGVRTWHDLDIERAFGRDAVATPRRLTHLVVFGRSADGVSSLESITPATATLEILRHFFIDALEVRDLWETVERFKDIRCLRMLASDARSAADLLERLA